MIDTVAGFILNGVERQTSSPVIYFAEENPIDGSNSPIELPNVKGSDTTDA